MDDPVRILIVDDEPPVIEGIRASISRELSGFEVIGSASNGREAIERARMLQPDLILLDVQMPGIDGIEALRTMRQQGVRSLAILVTAYERFDVARRGYGLGVRDYLVKPVGPRSIRDALEHVAAEIREERERRSEVVAMAESGTRVLRIVERALLHLVLAGAGDSPVVHEILEYLRLDASLVVPVLVRTGSDAAESASIIERLHFAVHGPVGTIAPGSILCIGSVVGTSTGELEARIRRALGDAGAAHLTLGEAVPLADVREAVLELTDTDSLVPDARLFHLRTAIVRAVRVGDGPLATRAFDEYLEVAAAFGAASAALEALLVMLSDAVAHHRGAVADLALEAILESRRIGDVEVSAQAVRRQILSLIQSTSRADSLSRTVRQALEIVRAEFSRDLGIEEIAERLGVSASHLSRTFSTEVGQPLSIYLADLRIQRAGELLEQNELSIKEIAVRCGYRDPNYFSRAFRAATGQTPSEYARSRRPHATN